jgi:hypothetical protein
MIATTISSDRTLLLLRRKTQNKKNFADTKIYWLSGRFETLQTRQAYNL